MSEQEEYKVTRMNDKGECEPSKVNAFINMMRARVRSILAFLILLWSGAFLWKVTFTPGDKLNDDAKLIVGFVIGTMVATLINFYFGASEKILDAKGEEESHVEEI